MCTIRFAGPEDAATVLRFIRALAEYEREPDAVMTTEGTLREQLASDAPPFECLLAEQEGAAVGFALFFHNYSTWRGVRGIYLEDIFVDPAARKSGVGSRLLKRIAELATERGCARVEWAVLNWNQLAVDFYLAHGAAPMDEWTLYRLAGEPLAALAGR